MTVPPVPDSAARRWQAAVEWGAAGWFARARTMLDTLVADAGVAPVYRSLAQSTRGSLTRQLGGHRDAAIDDGAAFVRVVRDATPLGATARTDALVGLAADALGTRRLVLSRSLLARARAEAGPAAPRALLRIDWVSAKLALAGGDAAAALGPARAALVAARELASPRHVLKSRLILAAASCATDPVSADAEAADIEERCAAAGLVPLMWAAAMLRTGIAADADGRARAHARARSSARVLGERGGMPAGM
ncbi:hypothetical protein DW322_09740 [Rhodococcus rhodnii]|nr:hypothetical protein [Rhodococcus rhodnii]TXG90454.1 hypothetical protein DW322_09740 [Rhodococcus rhodnii]